MLAAAWKPAPPVDHISLCQRVGVARAAPALLDRHSQRHRPTPWTARAPAARKYRSAQPNLTFGRAVARGARAAGSTYCPTLQDTRAPCRRSALGGPAAPPVRGRRCSPSRMGGGGTEAATLAAAVLAAFSGSMRSVRAAGSEGESREPCDERGSSDRRAACCRLPAHLRLGTWDGRPRKQEHAARRRGRRPRRCGKSAPMQLVVAG